MESKKENRGLNLVIVHKETRWKKFKGRVSSWFTSDKSAAEIVVVPEIIVTSPEDTTGSDFLVKSRIATDVETDVGETTPVKFRKSEKDELAKAHQDVIAQMRKSMAEARGDPRSDADPTVNEKAVLPEKPPIPPTKAKAVAKIREAIAQAKRESCQDLAAGPSNTKTDPESDVREDEAAPDHAKIFTQSPAETLKEEEGQKNANKESQSAAAGVAREKLRAALFPGARPQTEEVKCNHADTEQVAETEAEKAERKAAVRAKIRAALLSAAVGQVEASVQGPMLPAGKSDPRRLSTPSGMMAGGGTTAGRRKSASGLPQEKPKETIWEFFEEGKKKGTCKTCGYVVGIKHNKGGLTRHLSLVHQREYKDYNARMDKNWTHGMMERNLSMRVPKNI